MVYKKHYFIDLTNINNEIDSVKNVSRSDNIPYLYAFFVTLHCGSDELLTY